MLLTLRDVIYEVAQSPRFTVISEVAVVYGLGPNRPTPKRAARLLGLDLQPRSGSGPAAKRTRTTPGSAAGSSQLEASPSPSGAARGNNVSRDLALAAPRGGGAANRPATPAPVPEPADGRLAAEPTRATEFPFLDLITPHTWG